MTTLLTIAAKWRSRRIRANTETASRDFTQNRNMQTDSDQRLIDLIDRVAVQDTTALRELYELTSGKLYGLAMRVLGNAEWSEDALQDTFLQIWRDAANYRATLSPPMAWMGLMVRSRSLDLLRRRKAEREHMTDTLDRTLEESIEGDSPTPADLSQASQQAWALHQCLGRLDNGQRQAVSLAYLRDLSHSELATQLRQPLGTVKSWIRRGLDQLRQCLANYA